MTIQDPVTGKTYTLPVQEFKMIITAAEVDLKEYILRGLADDMCRRAHEHCRDILGTFGLKE